VLLSPLGVRPAGTCSEEVMTKLEEELEPRAG
jgi:hypothetical protein